VWENLLLSLPKRPDILAIQMGAGFILLVLLGGIMFVVPPMHVAVSVAAILTCLYFFTRPMLALFSVFAVRGVLDLLWWIPGTIGGLNMLQLFSAAVFILITTQLFLDLKRMQNHECFQWFLGYLLLMTIATVRSTDIVRNLDSVVRYLSPFILFFMVSIYFDKRRLRHALLLTISMVGIIPLTMSLYHLDSVSLHGYNRLLGGYKNLHNMALMTLMFLTLWMFWLIQTQSMFKTLLLLMLLGAGGLTLYKTYIRTGFLGFTVFIATALLFHRRYRTLATAGALSLLILFLSPDLQDRFSDVMLVFDTDSIMLDKRKLGSGRWGIWTISVNKYLAQPVWDFILGIGLGGQRLMTLDWVKRFGAMHITLDPHNDFLLLLFQIGPFGVLCYLAIQWKVYKAARAIHAMPHADRFARNLGTFATALTAMVFVTNCISNSFVHRTSPGWFYWCVCGLMFAEYADLKKQASVRPGQMRAVPGPADP